MDEQPRLLRVRISHDAAPEDPCEYGMWEVKSFFRHHRNRVQPEEVGVHGNGYIDDELQERLDNNTAFILSCYQHGMSHWYLHGTKTSQCRFDTTRVAGVLFYTDKENKSTPEDRFKWATHFMEQYTNWCNGECYLVGIEHVTTCEHCGSELVEDGDTVGGFIGDEDLMAGIVDMLAENKYCPEKDKIQVRGDVGVDVDDVLKAVSARQAAVCAV